MSDPSQYYGGGSSSRSYHGWSDETYTSNQHIQNEASESEAETAAGPPKLVPCATAPKPKRLKIGDWDEDEVRELIRLREEEGMKFRDIGLKIGRTSSQCNSQYGNVTNGLSRKHKPTQTNDHGGNVSTDTGSAMGAQPVSAQQQQQPSSSSKTSGSYAYVPEGMKDGPIFKSPSKGLPPWRDPDGSIDRDMYGLKQLISAHGFTIDWAVRHGQCDAKEGWNVVVEQCKENLKLEVEAEELRQCWEGIKEESLRRSNDAGGESHGT